MDVKYLNYILAIANRHNMTKAAEDLFVSQSSLSQYLSRLEQELGTPLFVRSKSDLSLTPAGRPLCGSRPKGRKNPEGTLSEHRGTEPEGPHPRGRHLQLGLRMLTEIIPLFREQYPGIIIEITETSRQPSKRPCRRVHWMSGLLPM